MQCFSEEALSGRGENINPVGKKKVLVAPLDWGLGHATRCIPIIRELLRQDAEVIIAADGRPFDLLKKEFPTIPFVRLPGYSVRYRGTGSMAVDILRQLPGIIGVIFKEHRTLKRLIEEMEIDAVVSDNRYGLFSGRVPTVFITHQISIMMPPGLQWLSSFVKFVNKFAIHRFTQCWIPDYPGPDNLSGSLSHTSHMPKNSRYIGPLSRFTKLPEVKSEYEIVAVISGPEPQRSVFENIIIEQMKRVQRRALVVRGVPEKNQRIRISDSVAVISSLESEDLNRVMVSAEIILSRPGYSTIMDLAVLGKKAILVPTPGQTEQEYLANGFEKSGTYCVRRQDHFDLKSALEESTRSVGLPDRLSKTMSLSEPIESLLSLIRHKEMLQS